MYRPPAYVIDDIPVLHGVMRQRAFGTIAAVVDGQLQFAYAPMVVNAAPGSRGTVRFHLARQNPLAELDGIELRVSFVCADAYVSPDWYETKGFVPTWNYIAVEGTGRAQLIDSAELRRLLADLSAMHEEKLRPKRPWTPDKLSEERLGALLNAIRGFAVTFETLEGKFKLSQDKSPANIAGVIAGLESRGDAASLAVARAVKEHWTATTRASRSSA